MIRSSLLTLAVFGSVCCFAQNVGIGTETPAEKLDVNGNMNVSGQFKVNGNAGTANQVLLKDGNNNPVWGNLSASYKNIAVFDCYNVTASIGANNCNDSWLVPDTVTSIIVECWGGGGGGSTLTGGAGGGYATTRFDVTPGTTLNFTIGAYGNFGNIAVQGGNTLINIGGKFIQANGGAGGIAGDPLISSPNSFSRPLGGGFNGTPPNFFGMNGSPGGTSILKFEAVSHTEYGKVVYYGNGGDAAGTFNTGGKGGYKYSSVTYTQVFSGSTLASLQGAGGASDATTGQAGRGGRLVIHY